MGIEELLLETVVTEWRMEYTLAVLKPLSEFSAYYFLRS